MSYPIVARKRMYITSQIRLHHSRHYRAVQNQTYLAAFHIALSRSSCSTVLHVVGFPRSIRCAQNGVYNGFHGLCKASPGLESSQVPFLR